MLFYYIFPLIIFCLVLTNYKKSYTGLIVIIILLFFSLFRDDSVGTDTMNYQNGLDDVVRVFVSKSSFFEDNSRYEYIYYLLCVVIYIFDLPPRILIDIFSVITFIFLYLGGKKNNVNIALVALSYVFLGMYYLSFNISRQFAAISICFYAIGFIKDNGWQKYKFFLWIFIACLIHKSVLLCAVLYFCRFLDFNRIKIGKIIAILYMLFVCVPITSLAFDMLSTLSLGFIDKYGANSVEGTYQQPIVGIIYKLTSGAILFYIYFTRTKKNDTDLIDMFFLVYMLVYAFLAEGNIFFFRLKFNFAIVLCIFLSDYFKVITKKNIYVFMLYCLLTYAYTIKTSFGYSPYTLSFDQIL